MENEDLSLAQINKLIKETVNKIDEIIEATNRKLPIGINLILLKETPIIGSKLSFIGKHCSIGTVISFSSTDRKSSNERSKEESKIVENVKLIK